MDGVAGALGGEGAVFRGVRAVFSGGTDEMLAEEVRRMVDAGLPLCGLHPHEATMEEIFVEVLKNEGGSAK